jgi:hypothetical protein
MKISRYPRKRWTTREWAQLLIPMIGTPEYERFETRYLEATGYRFDEPIPLGHALQLVTREPRPSSARKQTIKYLAKGLLHIDDAAYLSAWFASTDENTALPVTLHQFNHQEIEQFFTQFSKGFRNGSQFVWWARRIAQTKGAIRASASRNNLEKINDNKKVRRKDLRA